MAAVYIAAAGIGVLLWTPIFLQFLRSWRKRSNPVSLAICAAIVLIMWTSIAGIWIVTKKIDGDVFVLATAAMSVVVAIYAHAAFYWSKKRFVDQRSGRG